MQKFQDQECHHSKDVVRTMFAHLASYCHFCDVFADFFSGQMSRGAFHWAMYHCVVPFVSYRASKCDLKRLGGTA